MRSLFGHFCSGENFAHDAEMLRLHEERQRHNGMRESLRTEGSKSTQNSIDETDLEFFTPEAGSTAGGFIAANKRNGNDSYLDSNPLSLLSSDFCDCESQEAEGLQSRATWISDVNEEQEDVKLPSLRTENRSIRQWAYFAAAGLDPDCDSWGAFGGLACVKGVGREREL